MKEEPPPYVAVVRRERQGRLDEPPLKSPGDVRLVDAVEQALRARRRRRVLLRRALGLIGAAVVLVLAFTWWNHSRNAGSL